VQALSTGLLSSVSNAGQHYLTSDKEKISWFALVRDVGVNKMDVAACMTQKKKMCKHNEYTHHPEIPIKNPG
jgi:hypothetical protein